MTERWATREYVWLPVPSSAYVIVVEHEVPLQASVPTSLPAAPSA